MINKINQLCFTDVPMNPNDYCESGSQQSKAFPSKYLYDIYQAASTRINPVNSARRLTSRRPDLTDIRLSSDNVNREITTLSLVNDDVLIKCSTDKFNLSEDELYKSLLSNQRL